MVHFCMFLKRDDEAITMQHATCEVAMILLQFKFHVYLLLWIILKAWQFALNAQFLSEEIPILTES